MIFHLDENEELFWGHYSGSHARLSAAEAHRRAYQLGVTQLGYEAILPRPASAMIREARPLPQVIGWRYYPDAHGKQPCRCDYCLRGAYKGRKLLDGR